jgi:hypothetical protein
LELTKKLNIRDDGDGISADYFKEAVKDFAAEHNLSGTTWEETLNRVKEVQNCYEHSPKM